MRRLILAVAGALVAVGAVAVSSGSVQAGPTRAAHVFDRPLVVTSVTPSRHLSVLPDLSDPGLNGRVTVRFSTVVRPTELLDEQNLVNGLSANCDFRDPSFALVPGTASVVQNVLSIEPRTPSRPVLAQGRYTLTLKATIRSARGRRLNGGRADYATTFTVGSDIYPPVLQRVSPISGATDVGLRSPLVTTFDEPIDAASAAASVRLEDRSTDPPTRIPARVRVARRGFDVVVTPDARSGYPAGRDLTLVIAGRGTSTGGSTPILTDVGGHEFTRDAGPGWVADVEAPTVFHSRNGDFDDDSGEFTMTFRTRAVLRPTSK